MTLILPVSENTLKIPKNTCEKQMYSTRLCQSWPNVFNKYHFFFPRKTKMNQSSSLITFFWLYSPGKK